MIEFKSKKYLVYWHKVCNSGIWSYNEFENAMDVADGLAKQDGVYDVIIIDSKTSEIYNIKGKTYKLIGEED